MALITQTNGEQNTFLASHYEFRTTTMCGVNLSAPSLPPDSDPLRENPHQCRWKASWKQMERTPDASSAAETETPQSDSACLTRLHKQISFCFRAGERRAGRLHGDLRTGRMMNTAAESRAQSNRRDQYNLLNKLLSNPVFG